MSKFNTGDRVRYTYKEKIDTGEVTGVPGDVVINGEQWYHLRLDGYDADHKFVLPESGMLLLEQGADQYARERENLIEGDPIAVVDELLALRAEVKKLRAKVASGVEAAHDMQRVWWDSKHLVDDHYESAQDDAAWDILEAMEEPQYHKHTASITTRH